MSKELTELLASLESEQGARALAALLAAESLRSAAAFQSVSGSDVLNLADYILTGLRPGEAAEILAAGQQEGHATITTHDGETLVTTDRVATAYNWLANRLDEEVHSAEARYDDRDNRPTWQILGFRSEWQWLCSSQSPLLVTERRTLMNQPNVDPWFALGLPDEAAFRDHLIGRLKDDLTGESQQ